jgi:hypothetical protein
MVEGSCPQIGETLPPVGGLLPIYVNVTVLSFFRSYQWCLHHLILRTCVNGDFLVLPCEESHFLMTPGLGRLNQDLRGADKKSDDDI